MTPSTPSPFWLAWAYNALRDRSELSETGAILATAPLGAAAGVSFPGVQAPAAPGAGLVAAPLGTSQGPQAPPAVAAVPVQQHLVTIDSHGPAGDRTTSLAIGSLARGAAEPARSGQAPSRAVVATMSSQPGLASSSAEPGSTQPDLEVAVPLPRGADLIAEALPFAGDSLERSLEEFVRQLEAVDVAGIVTHGPTPIVAASLAVAGATASAVVVREVIRRRSERRNGARIADSLGRELALSFPEFPRSWSDRH